MLDYVKGRASEQIQHGGARPLRQRTADLASGVEVGRKIPTFRAPDQHGKMQDFDSIRGPTEYRII